MAELYQPLFLLFSRCCSLVSLEPDHFKVPMSTKLAYFDKILAHSTAAIKSIITELKTVHQANAGMLLSLLKVLQRIIIH